MIDIELCRICLADSIRMYPIEHTRYHEVFEWYTEDTMDMNEELPYSVCYLCNAVLNKLYDFLKNMIDIEIYLKESLRNAPKLTFEIVEKLKREMISKPHNLSKIWLRNSNFIALDAFKGHRPPRELQRYFEHPPIMIEYHKPYEHMRLEDIPEEQELEEINEDEPEETKEAETEEIKEAETEKTMEVETEQIKEAISEEIKDRGKPQPKLKLPEQESKSPHCVQKELSEPSDEKSPENEDQQIPHEEKSNSENNDSETTADQEEFPNDIDEIISIEENIRLVWSPEIENETLNIPNMEIDDEPLPNNYSSEQSNQRSESSDEKSPENEDQQIPHEEKSNGEDNDSETTADQEEFPNDIDEIISIEENIRLVWSPEIEIETLNIPNMEIDDEPLPNNYSSEQSNQRSESSFSNQQIKTTDPIDSFLLCAKKYRPPEDIAKSSDEYVTKEAVRTNHEKKVKTVKFHNPYLQFIEERIETEERPQVKIPETSGQRVKTTHPGKYQNQNKFHNPYLQFIEERIETEEKPQIKIPETSGQRVKTTYPGKYQNQNLQIIEHIPVRESEPEQTPKQMDIDKNIHTKTPSLQQKSTDLAVVQLEGRYYNLYLESVKKTPFKKSNEPLVIDKLTPVSRGPAKPVAKLIKPTTANNPAKIIVTSEPKKYLNSYVDFVKEIENSSKENTCEREKVSNEIPIPPKSTRKRNIKKKSSKKIVPGTPVQEKPSQKMYIDGKISGYCYFDHQKTYRRASILKKTRHPERNKREIRQLATKIKNRAAIIRKELLKFQKTGLNAEKVVEVNAVTKLAHNDEGQSGISELEKENSPKHLPLKSKEHSDKLVAEKPLKSPQDNKNRIVWRVVECPVKSKHTDRVSDQPKDQNQGDQDSDQVTLKDQAGQNDGITLEDQEVVNNQMWSDQEDNTMDSQVDRALKVLDESLKEEDKDPISRNEEDQEHNMPNDQNNHTLTDKNDPHFQLKDVCIIIAKDLEDNNIPKDQDNPSLVVQNVFTLKDQGLEDEDLIPKEQYDQIIMLANQDDQIMEDGNVAVKIESVDEEFQGSFEELHEEENVPSDTESFYNEEIMDPNNDSDDIIQHDDIKKEVEQNMQIDEEVSEYEPYLQERVSLYESATQKDQDGPSNYNNPGESYYNDIQGLDEQEHYTICSISQITSMPTVQLERLPIGLIKKTSRGYSSRDENEKYNCEHCNFKTKVRGVFLRHQNVHDINKQFVCNTCQHRFMSQYHLSRHKVIHDRSKYYCSYCDFKTTNQFIMNKHEIAHSKFNRFPCLTGCHRRFRTSSHRLRHACTKYLHKCEICNKSFRSEARYKRHLDKHDEGSIRHKCSICYRSFDTEKKCSNHLKQHGREESEKIKYICKWCNKNFSDRSNCKKHMKLHEMYNEKVLYETEYTQEMYETDNEVELHEKERREDEKFVCSLCPKLFDTETELGKHAVDHIL